MLSELNQLLRCRREREDRAAGALRRARLHQANLKAAAQAMEAELEVHHRERKLRSDQLYKQSMRSRLTASEVDDLNIELDLMGEQTDALVARLRDVEAKLEEAGHAVEQAAAVHQKHRQAGDRWNVLVDDVTDERQRAQEQAEEFAIEDDMGDRQAFQTNGGW